jgi:potassium-transporting ATPase KdpC subunit
MNLTTPAAPKESTLSHLVTSLLFTVVTVVVLGFIYPAVITLLGGLAFPHQAAGSLVLVNGKPAGSAIIGQLFAKPGYFHGRPSAAGKNGYDPTSTGGTNLGPTSKKLIDATKATIASVRKENPAQSGPPPMDLVTSSGSGIDPDISPEAAYYQIARVATARHMDPTILRTVVDAHVAGRTLGILGEPRINVFELNRALDAQSKP